MRVSHSITIFMPRLRICIARRPGEEGLRKWLRDLRKIPTASGYFFCLDIAVTYEWHDGMQCTT